MSSVAQCCQTCGCEGEACCRHQAHAEAGQGHPQGAHRPHPEEAGEVSQPGQQPGEWSVSAHQQSSFSVDSLSLSIQHGYCATVFPAASHSLSRSIIPIRSQDPAFLLSTLTPLLYSLRVCVCAGSDRKDIEWSCHAFVDLLDNFYSVSHPVQNQCF